MAFLSLHAHGPGPPHLLATAFILDPNSSHGSVRHENRLMVELSHLWVDVFKRVCDGGHQPCFFLCCFITGFRKS